MKTPHPLGGVPSPASSAHDDAPVVLVIENSPEDYYMIRVALERAGYTVEGAHSAEAGKSDALLLNPDIVVLDLRLDGRGASGIDVARHIYAHCSTLPIVLFSRLQGQERAIREAIEAGAATYVYKEAGVDLLVTQIKAMLRAPKPPSVVEAPIVSDIRRFGELEVDLAFPAIRVAGVNKRPTGQQWAVLSFLVARAGRVLTHDMLITHVWGEEQCELAEPKASLRQVVAELRELIQDSPMAPRYIFTEIGIGYKFSLPEDFE